MTAITMRTLSRETKRVIAELPQEPTGVVVTLDGRPVARLTPMSAFEQALYAQLIAEGVDPFNPPQVDPNWKPLPPVAPGEKTATDYLMDDRNSYDDEP